MTDSAAAAAAAAPPCPPPASPPAPPPLPTQTQTRPVHAVFTNRPPFDTVVEIESVDAKRGDSVLVLTTRAAAVDSYRVCAYATVSKYIEMHHAVKGAFAWFDWEGITFPPRPTKEVPFVFETRVVRDAACEEHRVVTIGLSEYVETRGWFGTAGQVSCTPLFVITSRYVTGLLSPLKVTGYFAQRVKGASMVETKPLPAVSDSDLSDRPPPPPVLSPPQVPMPPPHEVPLPACTIDDFVQ